jgi:hypothetical protein
MISFTKRWRRYCGPRSELVRATEIAADVVQEATGVETKVEVELDDRHGMTESTSSVDALTARHPTELADLESIAITVKTDTLAWIKEHRGEGGKRVAEVPVGPVRIRVSNLGTTLAVSGDDRTRVEGLSRQLVDVLGRAATNWPGFPRDAFFGVGAVLFTLGILLALLVGRWLDLIGRSPDRLALDETIVLIIGAVVGGLIGFAGWWLFPEVEILDEGGVGRARRFRTGIIALVGALIVAIVGSFIYDQVG